MSEDYERDASHLIFPNGQINPENNSTLIVRGNGIRLYDNLGNEYIDAISGLINVNVGYGRRDLNMAATEAMDLGYSTLFFGRSHIFAENLAIKLAKITPAHIEHFFFTLGGSDANDTAFRLVRNLNVARGLPEKIKILARTSSYHGATLATMSAGGETARHISMGIRMPGFVNVSQPRPGFDAIAELKEVIKKEGPETIAAFIGEPIAYQAGMIVPSDDYWKQVRKICDENQIVLIIDEVLTGCGRTGKMFAIEHWEIAPDILTLSKGLTSGYLPLGAIGISSKYYSQVLSTLGSGEGILGFTGTGHPASCAVALKNLEIIEAEDLVENARLMGEYLAEKLLMMQTRSQYISGSRVLGLLAGLDVQTNNDGDRTSNALFCKRIVDLLKHRRIFVRPFNATIAIAPPLIVSRGEIDEICNAIEAAIEEMGSIFLDD
jgi:putrescine aminotransferase